MIKKSGMGKTVYAAVFAACLAVHFYVSLIGWDKTITDRHAFRQTQTAMPAYYVLKEGFTVNYPTPVFGPPWSIPMEFPLYQWIVAGAVKIFRTPLDQTGRTVSLLFFYLTLPFIFSGLKRFVIDKGGRFLLLAAVLVNPIYLFWPRTFMMETTSLFFSVVFLWAALKYMNKEGGTAEIIIMAFSGAAGGLVKVTTFFIFCAAAAAFLLFDFTTAADKKRAFKDVIIKAIVIFLVPLAVSFAWVRYADSIKQQNPFAAELLTSKKLKEWNFGTLKQKISAESWAQINRNSVEANSMGAIKLETGSIPVLVLLLLAAAYKYPSRRKEILFSIAMFYAGPAVFTNLYVVHDYYATANCLFLSLSAGFSVLAAIETEKKPGPRAAAYAAFAVLLAVSLLAYRNEYYKIQKHSVSTLIPAAEWVKQHTAEDGVLLIYGLDWSSEFPYYAQRKAIMDRWSQKITSPMMQMSLEKLGRERIKALIMNEELAKQRDFKDEKIKYLGFGPDPAVINGFYIFLPAGKL